MSAGIIAALVFLPEARVDQRVPKKLLWSTAQPTAADKRQINDGIEEMFWVAALKPSTSACRRSGTSCASIWRSRC